MDERTFLGSVRYAHAKRSAMSSLRPPQSMPIGTRLVRRMRCADGVLLFIYSHEWDLTLAASEPAIGVHRTWINPDLSTVNTVFHRRSEINGLQLRPHRYRGVNPSKTQYQVSMPKYAKIYKCQSEFMRSWRIEVKEGRTVQPLRLHSNSNQRGRY